VVTVADMVRLQKMLIDSFGIKKLLAVAGGSDGRHCWLRMGGGVSDSVWAALPIATTARHSGSRSHSTKWGARRLMADPDWDKGKLLRQ